MRCVGRWWEGLKGETVFVCGPNLPTPALGSPEWPADLRPGRLRGNQVALHMANLPVPRPAACLCDAAHGKLVNGKLTLAFQSTFGSM